MLGFKIGTMLVLVIIVSSSIIQAHADQISITFDKPEYRTGDDLLITGHVDELTMPVIAVSIYDIDGKILSANSVEIESDGSFTKTLPLDSTFYGTSGQYEVKFKYGKLSQSEFFTISGNGDAGKAIEPPSIPEVISLATDKPQYSDGDTITIIGSVSTLDLPTVLIGIYDPFGTPSGFYFGQVNPNLEFSASFLAKAGVNFKTDGTYSIKAHYATSSKTTSFDFFKVTGEPAAQEPTEEAATQEPTEPTEETATQETTQEPTEETATQETATQETATQEPKEEPSNSNAGESLSNNEPQSKSDPDQKETDSNNSRPIIQDTEQETTPTDKESPRHDTTAKESSSSSVKNTEFQNPDPETTQENNLTVKDVALGLMLNQINLNCDSDKYSDTITYYDGMGPALYRLCKFDSSLNYFDEALANDPDNVEILSNKGSTLGKLGLYSDALVYYDHALAVDPDFLPALNNKANALVKLGQYDEAKSLYETAIEKNSSYVTAKKNLSLLISEFNDESYVIIPTSQSVINPSDDNLDPKESAAIETSAPTALKNEQSPTTFFDEISSALSSLRSLFGLLN